MRSAIQYENRVSTFLSRGFNIRNMGLDMGQVFKTLKIRMSYHFVASWHWLSYSCRGTRLLSTPKISSLVQFFWCFPWWISSVGAPTGRPKLGNSARWNHPEMGVKNLEPYRHMCWIYILWHCRCSMDFPIRKTCSMDLFAKTFVFCGFFYLHRSQKTHEFPHRWAQGASP